MKYYIGNIPYGNDLTHFGIKGMKWGVRRFQNDDGSLTPAGRERYYDNSTIARKLLTGNSLNRRREQVHRLSDKIASKQRAGKDVTKLKAKYEKANKKATDYDNYLSKTSTGKLFAQNLLMSGIGAESYRQARAAGRTRVQAMFGGVVAANIAEARKSKKS